MKTPNVWMPFMTRPLTTLSESVWFVGGAGRESSPGCHGSMSTPAPNPTSVSACSRFPLDPIDRPQPPLAGQYVPSVAEKPAALLSVTSGFPSPSMSPSIVTPPPSSGGSWESNVIVAPLSEGAKRIVYAPGSLFVAVIASRSETPSGPGFASRAATLDVFPFVASETVVTTMSDADRAAGAAADVATTRTSNAAAAAIFRGPVIRESGMSTELTCSGTTLPAVSVAL